MGKAYFFFFLSWTLLISFYNHSIVQSPQLSSLIQSIHTAIPSPLSTPALIPSPTLNTGFWDLVSRNQFIVAALITVIGGSLALEWIRRVHKKAEIERIHIQEIQRQFLTRMHQYSEKYYMPCIIEANTISGKLLSGIFRFREDEREWLFYRLINYCKRQTCARREMGWVFF